MLIAKFYGSQRTRNRLSSRKWAVLSTSFNVLCSIQCYQCSQRTRNRSSSRKWAVLSTIFNGLCSIQCYQCSLIDSRTDFRSFEHFILSLTFCFFSHHNSEGKASNASVTQALAKISAMQHARNIKYACIPVSMVIQNHGRRLVTTFIQSFNGAAWGPDLCLLLVCPMLSSWIINLNGIRHLKP